MLKKKKTKGPPTINKWAWIVNLMLIKLPPQYIRERGKKEQGKSDKVEVES